MLPGVAYQVALAVSTAVSALAARIAWRNRGNPGGRALAVALAAATVWAGSALAGALRPGTAFAVTSARVALTSVVVLGPSLLVFALEYTGREQYVSRATIALLSVEPVAFSALVWTNGTHGLVWRAVEFDGTGAYGVTMAAGLAYRVHTLYSYAVIALAMLLVVVFALRSRYLYQRQVTALAVATVAPWAANVAFHFSGTTYDLTPVAFTVTAVAFTWAVVREDFLDVRPVATEVVIDTIATAVFVVDGRGRIVEINERASDLLDVSTEAAIGDDARAAMADLPNARAVYDDLADATAPDEREFEAGDRYFRLQVSPLVERRERVVGRVFLLVDLTERRRTEERLKRRNEQLDRFAGVVSHDLRNPLQVAMGRLELARETGDEEHFDRVEEAHDRMDRLIEDLLALARQGDEPETESVELAAAARSAWRHVDTADASLSVAVDGAVVEADPDRLSQLFENTFRNAVEHGGEEVTVAVEPLAERSGFAVVDDGPGFGDADPDAVFDDGYTTSGGGTGFGLAIVAEIADQHGWSVAASEDGGARIDVVTGE